MRERRQRATAVAIAIKWLAIAAGLAAPFAIMLAEGRLGAQGTLLFGVAAIGAALRVDDRYHWLTLGGTVALAASAVSAAGSTGGPASFAYAAVFMVAADVAVQRGGGVGALFGGLGTGAVVLVMMWTSVGPVELSAAELYTLVLTPLSGLAFGTIHRDLPITGVQALRATTHVLDELVALSQRVQPGLDRWGVAEAVVAGLRDDAAVDEGRPTTDGPHLLISIEGVLHGVGAPWHRRPIGLTGDLPPARRARPFRMISREALPPGVAAELSAPRWLLHRIDAASGDGAVLVDARTHPAVLDRIIDTVSTATIALANSARFEELQSVATDAARTRLAADLHDGIAQALTHARFELELLSMQQGEEEAEELRRARGAADAALTEVRRTIGELRDEMPLTDSLAHHVDTVRAFARVPIELVIEGDGEPEQVVAGEVLRMAQEALSNALRHSGCSRVAIELQLDRDGLVLSVVDDGSGIGPDVQAGVGLASMRERAEAVGGDIRIGPAPGGGTEVELEVRTDMPFDPRAEPAMAGRKGPARWLRARMRRAAEASGE